MSSDTKYKLEYVWLDGYLPEPNLRAKTKIVKDEPKSVEDCPMWGFDGSSTQQAEGSSSDCMLKPVGLYPDSGRKNGYIVMCEVLNPDLTPHPSNYRATIGDEYPDLPCPEFIECIDAAVLAFVGVDHPNFASAFPFNEFKHIIGGLLRPRKNNHFR